MNFNNYAVEGIAALTTGTSLAEFPNDFETKVFIDIRCRLQMKKENLTYLQNLYRIASSTNIGPVLPRMLSG